jgi:hypothetical protein
VFELFPSFLKTTDALPFKVKSGFTSLNARIADSKSVVIFASICSHLNITVASPVG